MTAKISAEVSRPAASLAPRPVSACAPCELIVVVRLAIPRCSSAMSTAEPRLSICSGRSNWPGMLNQSPCGSRIAKGTKHAAATTTNEATAARRGSSAAAPPQVDDREREQDSRPELRRKAEPEQRAGEDGPLVDERRQAAEREQRRPEVIARAEQRAEHERRDGEEE